MIGKPIESPPDELKEVWLTFLFPQNWSNIHNQVAFVHLSSFFFATLWLCFRQMLVILFGDPLTHDCGPL